MILANGLKFGSVLASSLVASWLGSCTREPAEIRCAAYFDYLGRAPVIDDASFSPAKRAAYLSLASAFIDRAPGVRQNKIAKVRALGDSMLTDDPLLDECRKIIPSLDKVLESK